jgi:hypothetical protein
VLPQRSTDCCPARLACSTSCGQSPCRPQHLVLRCGARVAAVDVSVRRSAARSVVQAALCSSGSVQQGLMRGAALGAGFAAERQRPPPQLQTGRGPSPPVPHHVYAQRQHNTAPQQQKRGGVRPSVTCPGQQYL